MLKTSLFAYVIERPDWLGFANRRCLFVIIKFESLLFTLCKFIPLPERRPFSILYNHLFWICPTSILHYLASYVCSSHTTQLVFGLVVARLPLETCIISFRYSLVRFRFVCLMYISSILSWAGVSISRLADAIEAIKNRREGGVHFPPLQ